MDYLLEQNLNLTIMFQLEQEQFIDAFSNINFTQNDAGVHELQIHPGIKVLHNFSAIRTEETFFSAGHKIFVTVFDSGFMKEYFLYLPPFDSYIPKGLTPKQTDLFWKQEENHIHYSDFHIPHIDVVWTVKNGISSLSNAHSCRKSNSSHHLNFCKWPTTVNNPEIKGTALVVGSHQINYFQHFFDNGLPHYAAGSLATGISPQMITVVSTACNPVTIETLEKLGYKSRQNCQSDGKQVSAELLIMCTATRVVHHYFFDWYQELMRIPIAERSKVILLPRGKGSGGRGSRIIQNLHDIVPHLSKIFGSENVIIHDQNSPEKTLSALINKFSTARYIIGPHGGAFYNQFFSGTNTTIVEMLPVKENGYYPEQTGPRSMSFAHLAMYTNTECLHQDFYRYYTISDQINYNINITDFMNWFKFNFRNDTFVVNASS